MHNPGLFDSIWSWLYFERARK